MGKRKKYKDKNKEKLKEKAFKELNEGKYTQRELSKKYKIDETDLSRYFSRKYKQAGYPQLTN